MEKLWSFGIYQLEVSSAYWLLLNNLFTLVCLSKQTHYLARSATYNVLKANCHSCFKVFCELVAWKTLFELSEWKMIAKWVIHTLCKLPLYIYFVDYYKLELLRYYFFLLLLDPLFVVLGSLLMLILSNENTLLLLNIPLIFVHISSSLVIFNEYTKTKHINDVLFLASYNFNYVLEITLMFVIKLLKEHNNFPSIYFARKLIFSLVNLSISSAVYRLSFYLSYAQIRMYDWRFIWKLCNALFTFLYICGISYELDNKLSLAFIFALIVILISLTLITTNHKSHYAAAILFVLFTAYNVSKNKLWTVQLVSVPMAEFFSQFTLIGALLYSIWWLTNNMTNLTQLL